MLLCTFGYVALFLLGVQASVTDILDVNPDTLTKDRYHLLSALTTGFIKMSPDDFSSPYYGIKGFKALKENLVLVLKLDACKHLEDGYKDGGLTTEDAFYVLSARQMLNCTWKLATEGTIKVAKSALEKPTSTADVNFAIKTLQFLGQEVPNPSKIAQVLQQRLKEDDSLISLGYALHAASQLGTHGKFINDRIEDIVVQADEVDGKMLQWEGGLPVTSLLLSGLCQLPGAKPLTEEQADKFAAYLLSRKSVLSAKGAATLIEAFEALSTSTVSPVIISLPNSAPHTVDKSDLIIRVSDLLGRPLKPAPTPVVAQSATRVTDDVVVLSKQPLSPGNVPTEFVLPLKLEPGQYRIAVTAGKHSSSIQTRIQGPITVQSFEIGTGDSDGSSAPKLSKLQYPSKLTAGLQADANQNLIAKFSLSRPVHQAFLRLYAGKKEIVFIAEKDGSQLYKLNVNLATELSQSGTYAIELILGDSFMSNPISWTLGMVEVKLSDTIPTKQVIRGPKPEIKHMFREAEKRPPQAVSMFFTAAAAAPLLILLILWINIGIPLQCGNFYSIPFHIGFAGIMALYTYFWLYGNMFTTCAYLLYIGGFTFIAGNRMLSKIASSKK